MTWYDALIVATAVERLAELVISARNRRIALARGGVETGQGHFPAMVALHTGLLVACLLEARVHSAPPWLAVSMLVLVAASQGLRWWCVATLGPQWNTRVIVVPGLPLVRRGPYRVLRHPNYLAVVVEGFALPLVHGGWWTAAAFTVANAVLLTRFRIPAEERALATAGSP